jgi:hypothetical protein
MQATKGQMERVQRSSHRRSRGRGALRARSGAVSGRTVSVYAVSHLIDLGVAAGIRRDILTDAAHITDEYLRDG